jgi:hypothetical protein
MWEIKKYNSFKEEKGCLQLKLGSFKSDKQRKELTKANSKQQTATPKIKNEWRRRGEEVLTRSQCEQHFDNPSN